MFSKREGEEKQGEFWIESARVSKPKSQGFYSKLNEHLAEMDFARQVWALCAPAYCEESRGGRPGIEGAVLVGVEADEFVQIAELGDEILVEDRHRIEVHQHPDLAHTIHHGPDGDASRRENRGVAIAPAVEVGNQKVR